MKKILRILIIVRVLFPVGYYAWAQYEPFISTWSDALGNEGNPYNFFIAFFNDGTFHSLCQDKNFFGGNIGGVPYKESGLYTSSNDSVYLTVKESNVPNHNERIGITFGIKYIFNPDQYHTILFTNAPVLTFGWAKEDTIKFVGTVTSVNNSKWRDIKLKFLDP